MSAWEKAGSIKKHDVQSFRDKLPASGYDDNPDERWHRILFDEIDRLDLELAAARAERDEARAEAKRELMHCLDQTMAKEAAQERERAAIQKAIDLSGPCYCDPPGSGEEYCHDTCAAIQRAEAAEKRSVAWKRAAKSQRLCLNCGAEDQREICLAAHSIPLDAVASCPEHQNTRCPVWEDLHERALS